MLNPKFSLNSGDLKENVTFVFQDSEWVKKTLIGALLGIVPVLNFVTAGYGLAVIKNIRDERSPALPNWGENFGKYFIDGLIMVVISLIYALPGLVLAGILSAIGSAGDRGFGSFMGVLVALFGLLYGVVMIFWVQGAIINYAVDGVFGAAFALQKIRDLVVKNLGRLAMTVIIWVVGGIVMGIAGAILAVIPCLGWLLGWILSVGGVFYLLLVMAYNCGFVAKTISASPRPQPQPASDWEHLDQNP